MTIQSLIRSVLLLSSAFLFFAGGTAQAQDAEFIDMGRDEVELRVDVKAAVDRDTDVANTALVFNNAGRKDTTVTCTAYGSNGDVLGRGRTRVAAQGVKYIRASDLSNGVDFIGSALCKARGRIVVSSVFLAPGAITNLDVKTRNGKRWTRVRFPLIASY